MNDDQHIGSLDYIALAEFRFHIRRFLRFSEDAARAAGVEPQQYQLLLAVKGLPPGVRSRVGELASRLQIQHHSAVELINRLARQGLVQRKRSAEDRREVIVSLTAKGEKLLRELAFHHREELRTAAPQLAAALRRAVARPRSKPARTQAPLTNSKSKQNRSITE